MASSSLKFARRLVIVPAFNEADSIAEVVAELRQAAPDFDLLVIDDGSTDATAASVPPAAGLISLPFNLGIGAAMQTGYRYAAENGYDVAVQVDGDGQHPATEIRQLLRRLEAGDADLVIGSRFLKPGEYQQSPTRAAGSRILQYLLRMLAGEKFTDCTSGFRAANRKVIQAFAHWYPDDYPEPEVVLLLHRAGYRVAETPVRMRQRSNGETSITLVRGFYYVVKVAVALLLDTMREPWPQEKVRVA
ncbi:MAG: glycosyltransferase family 2 protein [Planctomycetota bacterium]|jgi:glycosyltransferase involved in cell wall biosynthesis